MIEAFGAKVVGDVGNLGRFTRFVWQTTVASLGSVLRSRTYPLIWAQMDIIGVRSVPVIMITGAFVGMTLAIQAYDQLAGMGLEEHLGVLINISVVKELGPVLAAVMLAGRVGGALTAELGTMKVTEQIEAVKSMGTDPMWYLVAPRVLACLLLTPFLIVYADLMGIVGGAFVSISLKAINSEAYSSPGSNAYTPSATSIICLSAWAVALNSTAARLPAHANAYLRTKGFIVGVHRSSPTVYRDN